MERHFGEEGRKRPASRLQGDGTGDSCGWGGNVPHCVKLQNCNTNNLKYPRFVTKPSKGSVSRGCLLVSFVWGETHQTLWQVVFWWCASEAFLSSSTITLLISCGETNWKMTEVENDCSYIVTLYKLLKHCNYAPEPSMKCLPRETASEMRNTYMSMDEIQWVFMGEFNYYILQLRSQRAPSAFDKAS